jgi:hypothetical protein
VHEKLHAVPRSGQHWAERPLAALRLNRPTGIVRTVLAGHCRPLSSDHPVQRPVALLIVLLAASLLGSVQSEAQDRPDRTTSINGTRNAGRGGATTAGSGDITSIGNNPAGLLDVRRREFALQSRLNVFVNAADIRGHDTLSTARFEQGGLEATLAIEGLEFAAVAAPCELFGRPAAAGVAWRRYSDGVRSGAIQIPIVTQIKGSYSARTEFESRGGLHAVSPSFAVEVADGLRLGATVNSIGGEATHVRRGPRLLYITLLNLTTDSAYSTTTSEKTDRTLALTLGGTWRPATGLLLGASATLPHDRNLTVTVDSVTSRYRLRAPLELALGASRQFANGTQLSLDLRAASWSAANLREDSAGTWVPRDLNAHDGSSLHLGYERPRAKTRGATAFRAGALVRRSTYSDERDDQVTTVALSLGETWTLGSTLLDWALVYSAGSAWRRNRDPLYDLQARTHDVAFAVGLRRTF